MVKAVNTGQGRPVTVGGKLSHKGVFYNYVTGFLSPKSSSPANI